MSDQRIQSMRDELYTSPTAPFQFTADADHTLDALMAARFASTAPKLNTAALRKSTCEFADSETENSALDTTNVGPFCRQLFSETAGTIYIDTPWETNVPCYLPAGMPMPVAASKFYKTGTTLSSVWILL